MKFLVYAGLVAAALAAEVPTVDLGNGVLMPMVNMGGISIKPSNYTSWFQLGGRGVDSAFVYGDETQRKVGEAIKASGLPRSEIFVTTKIPCCPHSRDARFCSNWTSADAQAHLQHDLEVLNVSYVDLMLLHWECDDFNDLMAHYRAMETMFLTKRARAIGVSNFNSSLLAKLLDNAHVAPKVNQCAFSIGNHKNEIEGWSTETLEFCKKHGITYEAYSPLGGLTDTDVLGNPTVKAIAAAHKKTPAHIALRWVVQQGAVVVTASDKAAHQKVDLEIFDFNLTSVEMQQLADIGSEAIIV